jgi:UDP-3-O-[3-hydroxymyristoyl] N-acetylglucosamine deacetylase/3-hydroxyacyl-[acyl-carrier-protein] dehydratase
MAKIIKIEQRNYSFDLNLEPLMDIHKIMSVLPHRPPFLFIDRIIEMSESHVVGMKKCDNERRFLCRAFSRSSSYAWCFNVEAMAQTGGILVLSTVPDPENYYFDL